MKSEIEIRGTIIGVTESYGHVLNQKCANVVVNAPLALMQLEAQITLNILYRILGEKRPRFACD